MSNLAYGSITVTDMTDRGIVGTTDWYKLSDNTSEDFESANKIPYPYAHSTEVIGGITFTVNPDHSVTANGTATANASFYLANKTSAVTLAAGSYTLSGCPDGGSSSTYQLRVGQYRGSNTTITAIGNDEGSSLTFSISSTYASKPVAIYIYIPSGSTVQNLTFYPMIESGSGVSWTRSILVPTSSQKYLWLYEITTYSDGSTSAWGPVVVGTYGEKGDKGDTGDAGTNFEYDHRLLYLSTSNTTAPSAPSAAVSRTDDVAGQWTQGVPTWTSGKYYWTCHEVKTSASSTPTWTAVVLDNNRTQSAAAAAAAQTAADNAASIANSKSKITYGTSAPSGSGSAGDMYIQKSSSGTGGDIIWQWNGDTSTWVQHMTGTTTIVPGSISTSLIAAGAVTAGKIDSGAVTTEKLDAGAVTAAKIASNAVTADKILAGEITVEKMSSGAQDAVLNTHAYSYTDAHSAIINLVPPVYYREAHNGTVYESNGVTWTLNNDGSVTAAPTVSGVAPSSNSVYAFCGGTLTAVPPVLMINPEQRYTLSGCPSGGGTGAYALRLMVTKDGTVPTTSSGATVYDTGSGATTTTARRYAYVNAIIYSGYTFEDGPITFYPMLEVGNVAHPYVNPRSGTSALGSQLAVINLLPTVYQREANYENPYVSNGVTWTLNNDGSVTASPTTAGVATSGNSSYLFSGGGLSSVPPVIFLDTDRRYTLSGCPAGGVVNDADVFSLRMRVTKEGDTPSSDSGGSVLKDTGTGVTTTDSRKYACVYAYINSGFTFPDGPITFYPMLEAGLIAHDYVNPRNGTSVLSGKMTTVESSITQQADKIALVVEESNGTNVIKSASIMTAINNDTSNVTIDADKVNITGYTVFNAVKDSADNLFINTLKPNVSAAAYYPRLIGQTSNTSISSGTKTTAQHGVRVTNTSNTRPIIRWGSTSGNNNLNGLVAGNTYTVAFDYTCKLYSGMAEYDPTKSYAVDYYCIYNNQIYQCKTATTGTSSNPVAWDSASWKTASAYLRFYTYDDRQGAGTQKLNQSSNVVVFTLDKCGMVMSGSFQWTFTIPAEASNSFSMRLQPNGTQTSLFPAGDFIEIRNLILVEGSFDNLAWSAAPQDTITGSDLLVTGSTTINGGNITTGTIDASQVNVTNINANNITTGKLKADKIDLFGNMTVYTDSTLATSGGTIGYMAGSHGYTDGSQVATDGMAIAKETSSALHYLIVTSGGVRMTEQNSAGDVYKVYLADGKLRSDTSMFLGANGRDAFMRFYQYDGHFRDFDYYSIQQPIWENAAPADGFTAQTLTLPTISKFNTFIICCRRNTSKANEVQTICSVPEEGGMTFTLSEPMKDEQGGWGDLVVRYRTATITRSNNTIEFSAGMMAGHLQNSGSQYIMIPTRILAMNIPYEMLHAGTLADPIPFNKNIRVLEGNYYSQSGVIYYCIKESPHILYGNLSNYTSGLETYLEVVE